MEEMKNLRDLLKHELEDLYSAEEQILEGLPGMIEKAQNKELKTSLNHHFKVTEQQKSRLDKVKKMLGEEASEEDKGFFAKLFSSEKHHCVAMEGLIKEGKKMMEEDMKPEVMDAAIIAAAQRIEHYEISGYGTAKAFAMHLGLRKAAGLLDETLKEEYEADSLLTDLAIGEVNLEADEDEGVRGLRKLPEDKVRENRRSTARSSSTGKLAKTYGGPGNGKSGNSKKSNGNSGRKTDTKKPAKGSTSKGRTTKSSSRPKAGSSRSKGSR